MPGFDSWAVLAASSAVGWLIDPVIWAVTCGAAGACYLWVAWRQELTWHIAWASAGAVGLLVNAGWLWDWLRLGWVTPPVSEALLDTVAEFFTVDELVERLTHAWSLVQDRAVVLALAGAAAVGIASLLARRRVWVASLLALGCVLPVLIEASDGALAISTWFGVLAVGGLLRRAFTRSNGVLAIAGSALALTAVLTTDRPQPRLGFTDEEKAVLALVREETDPTARILWEEARPGEESWTPLLPLLTGRDFLGGLTPTREADLSHGNLRGGQLSGCAIAEWKDEELERYFERYNIGWVLCRSPETIDRLSNYPGIRSRTPAGTGGVLITLDRRGKFLLSGSGELTDADHRRIAFKDVRPGPDGTVVLSFHHQPGMTVQPRYVEIERDYDTFHRPDPTPFVRLRLPGRVPRLTLRWEAR